MSYPVDLEEMDEQRLRDEIARRDAARAEGKCDYCGRWLGQLPFCRFPERHANHGAKP